jgi:hypothetical protein
MRLPTTRSRARSTSANSMVSTALARVLILPEGQAAEQNQYWLCDDHTSPVHLVMQFELGFLIHRLESSFLGIPFAGQLPEKPPTLHFGSTAASLLRDTALS